MVFCYFSGLSPPPYDPSIIKTVPSGVKAVKTGCDFQGLKN